MAPRAVRVVFLASLCSVVWLGEASPYASFELVAPSPPNGADGDLAFGWVRADTLWDAGPITDKNLESANLLESQMIPNNTAMLVDLGWAWPYPYTRPFTRIFSTVRLLGGWGPAMAAPDPPASKDVVYRAANGSLVYRWPLLWDRLDAVVANGVAPTVVLDNVPFCFVNDTSFGTYGQTKGPDDPKEFGDFVTTVASAMIERYGMSVVETFRWRVATEANNPGGHWNDTLTKFEQTYDFVAAGIKAVLPNAAVGPSNWCPYYWNGSGCAKYSSFAPNFVEHLVSGRNYAKPGQIGNDAAWFATSYYGSCHNINGAPLGGYDPYLSALAGYGLSQLRASSPRFVNSTIEYQEYATLGNCVHNRSSDPGTFGGAWTLQSSAQAVANGAAKVFHWGDFSGITPPGSEKVYLADSNLWLQAIVHQFPDAIATALVPAGTQLFDHAAGDISLNNVCSRVFSSSLGNTTSCGLALWSPQSTTDDTALQEAELVILASAFAWDIAVVGTVNVSVSFTCPTAWRTGSCSEAKLSVNVQTLDKTTSPFDIMYQDLKAHGGLQDPSDNEVYNFPVMANAAGREYVENMEASQARYSTLQRGTMTKRAFEGSFSCTGLQCTISTMLQAHGIQALHVTRTA